LTGTKLICAPKNRSRFGQDFGLNRRQGVTVSPSFSFQANVEHAKLELISLPHKVNAEFTKTPVLLLSDLKKLDGGLQSK
jgi:hypothetical protein